MQKYNYQQQPQHRPKQMKTMSTCTLFSIAYADQCTMQARLVIDITGQSISKSGRGGSYMQKFRFKNTIFLCPKATFIIC